VSVKKLIQLKTLTNIVIVVQNVCRSAKNQCNGELLNKLLRVFQPIVDCFKVRQPHALSAPFATATAGHWRWRSKALVIQKQLLCGNRGLCLR
jgi:hypothetical protein